MNVIVQPRLTLSPVDEKCDNFIWRKSAQSMRKFWLYQLQELCERESLTLEKAVDRSYVILCNDNNLKRVHDLINEFNTYFHRLVRDSYSSLIPTVELFITPAE